MNRGLQLVFTFFISISACAQQAPVRDTDFWQEYHEPYVVSLNAAQNQVRSIAVDDEFNVWIATIDGILQKKKDSTSWTNMLTGSHSGPAYAVVEHNAVIWMGTWKGVY